MNNDRRDLELLAIFHYVLGGIIAVVALFPVIHFLVGLFFLLSPEMEVEQAEEAGEIRMIGWIFVGVSSFIMVSGWILAALVIFAGRSIAKRKRYLFCLVMAGIECIFMPFGTALGAFTIIVLVRESVKAEFEGRSRPGSLDSGGANLALDE